MDDSGINDQKYGNPLNESCDDSNNTLPEELKDIGNYLFVSDVTFVYIYLCVCVKL